MSDYKRLTTKKIDLEKLSEKAKSKISETYLEYAKMNNALYEWENDYESGKVVELPCKVGDTVWTINCWQEYGKKELGESYIVTRYELHENKCSSIEINDRNHYRGEISINAKESYKGVTPYVFLTREEAEKKLKELQNG